MAVEQRRSVHSQAPIATSPWVEIHDFEGDDVWSLQLVKSVKNHRFRFRNGRNEQSEKI